MRCGLIYRLKGTATLREGYSYIWMSKSNQLVLMIREDPKMVSTIKGSIENEFKRSYGKPFDWHVLLKNSNIRKFARAWWTTRRSRS